MFNITELPSPLRSQLLTTFSFTPLQSDWSFLLFLKQHRNVTILISLNLQSLYFRYPHRLLYPLFILFIVYLPHKDFCLFYSMLYPHNLNSVYIVGGTYIKMNKNINKKLPLSLSVLKYNYYFHLKLIITLSILVSSTLIK